MPSSAQPFPRTRALALAAAVAVGLFAAPAFGQAPAGDKQKADEVEALNQCLVREDHFIRGSLQLPPVDVEAELAVFDRSP